MRTYITKENEPVLRTYRKESRIKEHKRIHQEIYKK